MRVVKCHFTAARRFRFRTKKTGGGGGGEGK